MPAAKLAPKPTLADKVREYGGTGIAAGTMPPDLATSLASKGIMLGAPNAAIEPPPLPPGTIVASPATEKFLHNAGARFVTSGVAQPKAQPMNAQSGVALMQGVQQGLAKAGAVSAPPEVAPSAELAPSPGMVVRPAFPMLVGAGAPIERYRVGPQVRAAYATADESARRAVNENEALALQGPEREQEVYRQAAEDEAIDHAKSEVAEKDRKAVAQSYQEQYDHLADEVAGTKIDPNRAWSSKSTAQKVGSVIHDALRGFLIGAGAGDIGGTLQQEIDRDIDVQKADLANKRAGVEARRGALSMALQRFGDQRTAEAAAKASLADQLKARLGALAAQSKSDQVKENANTAIAALDQQKAANLNAMMAYGAAPGSGSAAGTLKMGDAQFVPLGDGTGIMARSDKEGDALRGRIAARDAINGNLQKLLELEKNSGFWDRAGFSQEYKVAREQLIADTENKKTVFEGQGAMSEGDKRVTDAALGAIKQGSLAHLSGAQEKLIQQAIQGMNASVETSLKSQGGPVVMQVYGRDAHGQVVPRYVPIQGQYTGAPGSGPPPSSFKAAGAPAPAKGGKK